MCGGRRETAMHALKLGVGARASSGVESYDGGVRRARQGCRGPSHLPRGGELCLSARRGTGGSVPCREKARRRAPMCMALDPSVVDAQTAAEYAAMVSGASTSAYVPGPVEDPGAGVYWGFAFGVFPFVWASYEFWKRIDYQQRCATCTGSGLVENSRGRLVKCSTCGGMIPWLGWRRFWLSNFDVGNGGVLQRPSKRYDEINNAAREKRRLVEVREREGAGGDGTSS